MEIFYAVVFVTGLTFLFLHLNEITAISGLIIALSLGIAKAKIHKRKLKPIEDMSYCLASVKME